MKKTKKGFTIVELVVVIAVIAILAAVLIPTFISIVNKAKVSNDNQLVRNLNTALITEEVSGNKAENMSQAIKIAEDYGYLLDNLQAKAEGCILLWNQTSNRFYVKNGTEITSNPEVTEFPTENYTYWAIAKTLSAEHSTFLTEGSGDIAVTDFGVDVSGISSPVNVAYTGNANAVIIVTNGGDLSVNAATGHVTHYGFVKSLVVTAVDSANCYREHGYVGTLAVFGAGKFVAEKGAQFHQVKAEIGSKIIVPNVFVDLGATYGIHRFDDNGVCVIAGCNVTSDHDHIWGEWATVIEATCANAGEEKRVCGTCRKEETRAIAATGKHSYVYTDNGYDNHTVSCSDCDYSVTEPHSYVSGVCSKCKHAEDKCAAGHKIDESTYVVLKEQTCTETGMRLGKCTVCNNWIEETIPMHRYSSEWTGNNYNHWHYCVDCYEASNSGKSGTFSDKGAHDSNGENGTCSICGYDNTQSYFANKCSHVMKYKKFSDKYHDGACKICGFNQVYNEAHDVDGEGGACSKCGYKSCEHNVESWTVTAEPTCLEKGEEQAMCSICNKTIKRKIPASGHAVTNFTEVEVFNHTGTCDRCKEIVTERHEYSEVSITSGENGKKYYECACGAFLEVPEDYGYELSELLNRGCDIKAEEWGKTTRTINGKDYTVYKAVCNSGIAKGVVYIYLIPLV